MSTLTKQERKEQQEKLYNRIMWIPLIILLAIVPLIVRAAVIYTNGTVLDVINKEKVGDIYSNYKSTAIIMLSIGMAVIAFLCVEKSNIKLDKTVKCYLLGGGIFLGISLLATVLSDNRHTAWWGMPDRAEGFIIILCYAFIVYYTLYALRNHKNYIYIISALSFLVVVTTIIGAFQYFRYDLFLNVSLFKKMIISKEYISQGYKLTPNMDERNIIGTMGHYNYVGSFGAMMVPFFSVLTLFAKDMKQRVGLGIITLCAMFLLFGSLSRAGIVGLILAVMGLIIIFSKKIVKKWVMIIPIILVMIGILFGFNQMTNGTIFERIPSLTKEAVNLFSGSQEGFDYRDHIPVRDVIHEDNKEKIVLQGHEIHLGNDQGDMTFTDENGETIQYVESKVDNELNYTTSDERFADFSFQLKEIENPKEEEAPVVYGMSYKDIQTFYFMLDSNKGVVMVDACPVQEEEIDHPETVGFNGKEKLGSARGYIWSRSIPLMKKTLFVGYGPDTYVLKFPQRDYLGKWWAYEKPHIIVDKAHSLYMGIWINQGALALIGFLIAVVAYTVQSFKLYALKGYYEQQEIMGIATFAAVIGYLGAGLFNDSVVSVTPIFCILLGAGMGINFLINKERTSKKIVTNKVVAMNK